MPRFFSQLVFGICVITAVLINTAQAGVSEQRAKELTYLLHQDCGACHGMTLKGGLGPPLLPQNLINMSVADISAVITYGRVGTPMPPWKAILTDNDIHWLSKTLKAESNE
ncbi:MAG: cytochrome c [Methylococcales bacterium]|jgi:cytochrome c55X|nr:cytochrome c [Methylococcales bacterium]MBT7411233.1 cytochrome c [Methylococcales bacterium]